MNCKILSRLLLATTCFVVSSVINLLSASEISNANNTEYNAQFSFYTEFNQNSVVEYAKLRGINFEDAKDTFGYKANCERLPDIITIVNEVTKFSSGFNNCLDKNCLATMLFATEIGLPINNFKNCSSEDAKKMLYAITNLNSGNYKKDDVTFNSGMSYVNGFLVYNMCLNVLTTSNCLSIYQNFYSAKEALKDLLLKKISNDPELQQYANKLVPEKSSAPQSNLENSKPASTYLTRLLTSNYDELIILGKSFDNILFSKIADIFRTRESNKSVRTVVSKTEVIKTFGRGLIEVELFESRKHIFSDEHLSNLLNEAGIDDQESYDIKKTSMLSTFISTISDDCREAEHWFEIYRKKMDIWDRAPKDICKITGKQDLTEDERKKFLLLSDLKAKSYVNSFLDVHLFDAGFNFTSEFFIKKQASNLKGNSKKFKQHYLDFSLLSRFNSLKDFRTLGECSNCKLDYNKLCNATNLVLKYIEQFRNLSSTNKNNLDYAIFAAKDTVLKRLGKTDMTNSTRFSDCYNNISKYIKTFFDQDFSLLK